MDVKIYVVGHKEFKLASDPKILFPLIVGNGFRAETVDSYSGELVPAVNACDGENIEYLNPYFCELTGLYWIWKNDTTSDIVGLNHYRRYFCDGYEVTSKLLTKEFIEKKILEDGYDFIVQGPNSDEHPKEPCLEHNTVYNQYKKCHVIGDLDAALEIIQEKYPDISPVINSELKEKDLLCICNLMVCKKQDLDKYCEFLFDVLFELEKRINYYSRDSYQKRCFGFLSERIFRPWLVANNYKFMDCAVAYPGNLEPVDPPPEEDPALPHYHSEADLEHEDLHHIEE